MDGWNGLGVFFSNKVGIRCATRIRFPHEQERIVLMHGREIGRTNYSRRICPVETIFNLKSL